MAITDSSPKNRAAKFLWFVLGILIITAGGCSSGKKSEITGFVKHYKEKYPEYQKEKKKVETTDTHDNSASVKEIGNISAAQQRVLIRRGSSTVRLAEAEIDLIKEDHVFTDSTGKARILLTEGAEVFMAPASNLNFNIHFVNRLNYEHQLSLRGKVRAKVDPTAKRRLIIKTAHAEIAVKGTDFIVESRKGKTKIATLEGVVEVTSSKTRQRTEITENKLVTVSSRGQISPPKKIEPELIKDLEYSGATGNKEMDKIIESSSEKGKTDSDKGDDEILSFDHGLRVGLGLNIQHIAGSDLKGWSPIGFGPAVWVRYFQEQNDFGYGFFGTIGQHNYSSSSGDSISSGSRFTATELSLEGLYIVSREEDRISYVMGGIGVINVENNLRFDDGSKNSETNSLAGFSVGVGGITGRIFLEFRYLIFEKAIDASEGLLKINLGFVI